MKLLDDFQALYTDALNKADSRVETWPLMQSPIPVFSISFGYILVVYLFPKLLKHRPPLDLKVVLVPYNFALVALSVYMLVEFITVSVLSGYSYKCQPVDYTDDPLAVRMAKIIWWFFFSKVIELLDTVFLILRKHNVSFLHAYHHCTMIVNYWFGTKFVAGGQAFFIPMLNCFVHSVMYMYYGLAVMGPHMQKYLWWKKYLTKLQLVQFLTFIVHTGYNLLTDCEFPKGFNVAAILYSVTLIVLFSNFYYQSYVKAKSKKDK